ncbi:MAG: hypothetical protein HRT45_17970 [Bdellovibrionales bacterium]|nr:hypothetical protein [Bdellovibrionales bacterium]
MICVKKLIIMGAVFMASFGALALEPPLCDENSTGYDVCQNYRYCIMMGQLMGEYTSSYLKSTCRDRAKDEFNLTDKEFDEALESATITCKDEL